MVHIIKKDIDLDKICRSGQCFRMYEVDEKRYALVAFEKYLILEETVEEIIFDCTEDEFQKIWKFYFDLEQDYQIIEQKIDPADLYLSQAASHAKGIRILQQELWEMIVSFLISQQSNIKRIQKTIELLSQKYGTQMKTNSGIIYYAFPTPKQLENVSQEQLREDKLGYRAPYIVDAVQKVLNKTLDLNELKTLDYENAKKELLKCKGIGVKVAECICLFGLHHLEAFPVDTHINHVIKNVYPEGFPMKRYEKIIGVIQQYMFYEDLYFRKIE